ncbi:hypothetical protein BGZ95_009400 [Linnemannia exigua]|uniref:Large ribosomal subunit protein uL6 alpha-beta domain-containing protein n=1 Tax=Linnemannia exigua TaxID=604196 RepID=A0AAD4DEM6_9FUNG|nr:hypothetical protein BGZ95_009400 [Linnemannia exigua]
MSITLPFSSFTSAPAAPSQPADASSVASSVDSSNATQPSVGATNLADFLAAQPLATKPIYKKRITPSAPRPDGLIKRSGAEAAVEKTQRRQTIESATKSKGNIYDRSVKTRSRTLPASLAEQLNPPHKKQRIQKNKKIKAAKAPKQPRPKPPSKPRVVRVPKIWTPHEQTQQQLREPSQQVAAPLPSDELASNGNSNSTTTIEFLVKQQEAQRERLAQLATRPLPLQELQTLVCTELEEEHESLKALGILLHKELLKLRLEEGVMLNMLHISESGILDVRDLERVKARRPPSARQLEAYDRMNERHYQRKLRLAKAARATAIAKRAAMGVRSGVTEEDAMYAQAEQRNRVAVGGRRRARRRYVTEDEGEDEEEGVEGENGEDATDREQTDTESTKPKYQFPAESYSFRPVISSSQPRSSGSIGQPQASSSPALVSLEEIKKLVIKRANKRTAVEMVEQEVEDDDLYELEFDEEEELPVEEQRGQHDDDEMEQHQDMGVDNNQNGSEEDGDEGEDDEEEGEEEGEGEYYTSDEDGEGPGGDNEEDEDAARLALQRMLTKMKDIYKEEILAIPEGVKVEVKARQVTVTGPRGTLSKNFRHVEMDIVKLDTARLRLVVWHGKRKHVACLRTIRSLINNMIIGVTKGYEYKMRFVYAHFPINVIIADDEKSVEIRNFLGQKIVMKVPMLEGVTIFHSKDQKDEITLIGNDLGNVSQSAANIQQATTVKNKDIRKFLDGIYVSQKGQLKGADEE